MEATYAKNLAKTGKPDGFLLYYKILRCGLTGRLKVLYLMLEEQFTPVSSPRKVDGILSELPGIFDESCWYPMYDEEMLPGAAANIANSIGNNARFVPGYLTDKLFTLAESTAVKLEIALEEIRRLETKANRVDDLEARIGKMETDKCRCIIA